MRIITVAIQKGGTGKTTTAAALAQAAAYKGEKCLAIDLDPQANLSFVLNADTNGTAGSYELIQGEAAADIIQTRNLWLDVIPANWSLSTLTTSRGSARRLQKALEPIKDRYDLIIIDTPPTAGELQYNALQAATDLIIPLEADTNSLQGLYTIVSAAGEIRKSNPELSITGVLITRYDKRPKLNRFMRDTIEAKAKEIGIPYLGEIRSGIAVREASAMQESLFDYAAASKPAQDYLKLFNELSTKGE